MLAEKLHRPQGPRGVAAEAQVPGPGQDGGPRGVAPKTLEPAIKPLILWRKKGKGRFIFLKKKKSHTKIDPFAKQFLSQEAPPPIFLETEGEVLGRSQRSPHSRCHAPELRGGRRVGPQLGSRGLVQRSREARAQSRAAGRGRPHGVSVLPAGPHALAKAAVEQIKVVLFAVGGLSQEGGVRVGCAPHLLRSSSRCHTASNK